MDEIPALLGMEYVPEEDREKPPWRQRVRTYRSQFYPILQQRDLIPVWEFWNYNFDPLTPRRQVNSLPQCQHGAKACLGADPMKLQLHLHQFTRIIG